MSYKEHKKKVSFDFVVWEGVEGIGSSVEEDVEGVGSPVEEDVEGADS